MSSCCKKNRPTAFDCSVMFFLTIKVKTGHVFWLSLDKLDNFTAISQLSLHPLFSGDFSPRLPFPWRLNKFLSPSSSIILVTNWTYSQRTKMIRSKLKKSLKTTDFGDSIAVYLMWPNKSVQHQVPENNDILIIIRNSCYVRKKNS